MEQKLKLELIKKLLRKEGEEGFSLLELVVVVAVLAVLSAIAIPSFQGMILRARQAAAATFVDAMIKSAAIRKANNGGYPTNWNEIMEYAGQVGNSAGSLETCDKYGSQCNGNERAIVQGQYIVAYWSESNRFGVSVSRFNNIGPTSKNMHVMGCLTDNKGGGIYLFKEDSYYQGKPWNRNIIDNEGNELDLCRTN